MSNDITTDIASLATALRELVDGYLIVRLYHHHDPKGYERAMIKARREVEAMENFYLAAVLPDDAEGDQTPINYKEAEYRVSFDRFDWKLYVPQIPPTKSELDRRVGTGVRSLGKWNVTVSGVTYQFSLILHFHDAMTTDEHYAYETMVFVNGESVAEAHGSFEECADFGSILMRLIEPCKTCNGTGFIIVCDEEGVKAQCEACS